MQNVFEEFDSLKEIYAQRKSCIVGYEDSFFSILQGIRHAPYLFENNLFFTIVPDRNEIIVYNRLDDDIQKLLADVQKLLLSFSRKKAIYKNVAPEDEAALSAVGFRHYIE